MRDECIALNGPESEACKKLIEAHKECLRSEGFHVRPQRVLVACLEEVI